MFEVVAIGIAVSDLTVEIPRGIENGRLIQEVSMGLVVGVLIEEDTTGIGGLIEVVDIEVEIVFLLVRGKVDDVFMGLFA